MVRSPPDHEFCWRRAHTYLPHGGVDAVDAVQSTAVRPMINGTQDLV